jgi:hypothetical protein
MLSRGYDGAMPVYDRHAARRYEWWTAMTVPALAIAIALSAWAVR